MRSICKNSFYIILIFSFMLILPVSSFSGTRISVMISQHNQINDEALASFVKIIISNYGQIDISTYDLAGNMENGNKIAWEIQKSKPNLVLTVGTTASLSAKKWLKNIPIVFCMVLNPVSSGLVDNMESPGGNITGASLDIPIRTQFEYIKSIAPNTKSIGVLYNPGETGAVIQTADKTAKSMNLILYARAIRSEREIPDALKGLLGKVDFLWSVADGIVFEPKSTQYILLNTLKTGVPFMGLSPSFVKAGALVALSCSYSNIGKQAAEIAGRILRGEQPARIPISTPIEVSLSINLKTAGQIGLNVPSYIIRSADMVIK